MRIRMTAVSTVNLQYRLTMHIRHLVSVCTRVIQRAGASTTCMFRNVRVGYIEFADLKRHSINTLKHEICWRNSNLIIVGKAPSACIEIE